MLELSDNRMLDLGYRQFGAVVEMEAMAWSTWLLTAILLPPIVYCCWRKYLSRYWKLVADIPGPLGYPIIGNLFEFMTPRDKIFVLMNARSKKYFPIFKMVAFHLAGVHIVNPEDIELVVTNMKHNSKIWIYDFLNGWLGTGLLTSSGTKWQKRRKILTPAFHFNILQDFLMIFHEETEKLVEQLEHHVEEVVDVMEPITEFTLRSIEETAMGITSKTVGQEKDIYKDAISKLVNLLAKRVVTPWLAPNLVYNQTKDGKECKVLVERLHKFSKEVIRERQNNIESRTYSSGKRMAMLDLLLTYKANGADIDDEGIREEVDTFMFEGHDTTSMAICFTLMLLANHKDIQDEVVQEIKEVLGDSEKPSYNRLQELNFMERVIKESLRLYPSVPFISRMSGEDIKTHTGYIIPKDCFLGIYIYDMHHNPNVFPDPEKFDPDRFLPENCATRHPFAYLPFSAGPRNCIGQRYAILEIKAVLCGILKKFTLEPVDKPEDIEFIADMVLRPKNGIKVKFVLKKN